MPLFLPLLFLLCFTVLWTLVPSFALISPPLDVVEMLAWGQEWQLGYYKHPPLPAWLADLAYRAAGNHVWGVYALSQLCLLLTLFYVFRVGKFIFNDSSKATLSSLILLGTFYFSYPMPEFNHNVIQMPLWAAFSFYAVRIYLNQKNDWLILGILAGASMYAKYSSALIILSFMVVYLSGSRHDFLEKLKNPWIYLSIAAAFLVFLPHLLWLIKHDFQPITYAADRVNTVSTLFSGRVLNPLEFLLSQAVNILPALLIGVYAFKRPFIFMTERTPVSRFIYVMCFGPLILSLILSVTIGLKLLPMWGMTYWNLLGIWIFYVIASEINLKKFWLSLSAISAAFLIFFSIYYSQGHSTRRSFPAEKVTLKILEQWQSKTDKPLNFIIADEWIAGNLALSLPGRPKSFLYNDTNKAPWINPDRVKEQGAVVLWRNHKPDDYPAAIQDEQRIQIGRYNATLGFLFPQQQD